MKEEKPRIIIVVPRKYVYQCFIFFERKRKEDKLTRSYLHIFLLIIVNVKDQYFLGEQTSQSIVQLQKKIKEMVPKQGR